MHFQPLAEARGFLYCYPDSLTDRAATPFWNATDTCCDFWDTGVDDAGFLRGVITEIGQRFALERASDALQAIDERRATGKVVLDVRAG